MSTELNDGSQPRLSLAYRLAEAAYCRKRALQAMTLDCACVPANAGSSITANTAIVARTTSSSITVKAVRLELERSRLANPPLRPKVVDVFIGSGFIVETITN